MLGFQIYLKGFKLFQMGLTAAYALIYMALIMLLAKLLIGSFRLREPDEPEVAAR